jgi:hypothetical protein
LARGSRSESMVIVSFFFIIYVYVVSLLVYVYLSMAPTLAPALPRPYPLRNEIA